MDPNANLQEQEQLITRKVFRSHQSFDATRLRILRRALRVWLTDGGFEPDWAACPRAARYYRQFRLYLQGAS